jgi:hypothetical protein
MSALKNLYDLITEGETYLPRKNNIKNIIDNSLKSGGIAINTGLHPQSPLTQLYRAKDWTVDDILRNCSNIRTKQDRVTTNGLAAWEISFIAMWERLKYVKPEFRSMAKGRMIANGDKELHEPIYLEDIMEELKPIVKVKEEREEKIVDIATTLDNIF